MINKRLSYLFKGDKVIWMVFFFLFIISIVEVYSASPRLASRSANYLVPVSKHIGFLIGGFALMLVVINIPCRYFKHFAYPLLYISIPLLVYTLFMGQKNGASRWIDMGFFSFQPSEMAKGSLVLATALILSRMQLSNGANSNAFRLIIRACLLIVPLIMVENLSTAMLLCCVVFFMMIIGRVPIRQLGRLLGIVMLVGALGLTLILAFGTDEKPNDDQQKVVEMAEKEKDKPGFGDKIFHRFGTWKSRIIKYTNQKELSPTELDLDKDAQPIHANIAIVSSNILGKGPGNSTEANFLAEAYSDFIYAIIIEETGIVGAIGVAMLYIILLFRTGRIANRCENNFPALLAMGLALLIVTQALFNMCVAVGLVPVTGQPLPLISKGGTSCLANCIYIGVILSVSRSAKKKESFQTETAEQEATTAVEKVNV